MCFNILLLTLNINFNILILIAFIIKIWVWLEPTMFFITLGLSASRKNYTRVELANFENNCSDSYEELVQYIEQYGFKKEIFAIAGKDFYLKRLRHLISTDGKFYTYIEGKIEKELINMFKVPTDFRFDKFLLNTYLHIHWKTYLKYSLVIEKFLRIFTSKKTVFHYLAISGWLCRNHNELIEEIKNIKDPKNIWKEAYGYKKLLELANKDKNSSVKKVLDKVLTKGKITNQSILNIISSEKILLIHKYAEGFKTVREKQDKRLQELKKGISRLSKLKSKRSVSAKNKLIIERNELINNWIRGPVGITLENNGFKKLFPKNDFTYFIPLSQIPLKYQNDYKTYINEVILIRAKEYLKKVKNSPYLDEFEGDLKYIIISEVIQLNELMVLTQERDLGYTAPQLNAMLVSTYLEKGDKNIVNLYINDVVRNVDFKEQLNLKTKSGQYVYKNFQHLKTILWSTYNIDIYKPTHITKLSENYIEDISDRLFIIDNSLKKGLIKKILKDVVNFYIKLDLELKSIKEK